jgi:hypothetical protein
MNEEIDDYCKVEGVITFCNNVSYDVLIIQKNKKIVLQESSIHKIATINTPMFQLGLYVGVKIHPNTGYGYNNEYTIQNGVITKINQWFDSVTYDVSLEDNTVVSKVYESHITQPYKPPTPLDTKEFLKTREQELLEELYRIRQMMCQ